ncbi:MULTISPECIES: site-specific integrase [unclassified Streptomyces]|uniref:tyrosine-type recombinase/integrase n=1 Tax=unclassified Streptomyces TaxID=2593676 RepID=UPI00225790D7|nr:MULTISPECIES: site-specific integrase [unclassified Streptomyces]MCX4406918.1 site-specific integrase [Streptomyces sp. NBC_01764]MCX5188396.1 site-specific integrase [Streptomyces sp. NBC_00268]
MKKKKDPVTGKRERTARYGKGKRYKVAGIPGVRDRSFDTLEDAKAWLRRAATDEERGEFVDPRDGSITLADYIAMHWVPGRGGVPKTQDNQERRARLHIIPHLGQLPLRNITAADLRAYIAKLESTVSSVDYQRGILSELSSILEAAVDDKRLAGNPMHAKSVRWPKAPQERRDAWPLATAMRVRDVINPRNRITVVLGLGCGLRQGEVFGLSPEDVDYARGVIHVRRQVQAIKGRLYFALPKGKKTRVVDMPSSVAEELKRHVEAFPPVKVELPWGRPEAEGQRKKFALLLTTRFGNAIAVNTWNTYTWKPALAKAGIIPPRAEGAKNWQWEAAPKDGFHVLRHTYASIMLEAGESVVTVARWLGHSSPAITLGYYAHFMPEAGSKGRTTIDGLLGRQGDLHVSGNSPDSPQG